MSVIRHETTKRIKALIDQFFDYNKIKVMMWFDTPNPMLGLIAPQEMIDRGRGKQLLSFVERQLKEQERMTDIPVAGESFLPEKRAREYADYQKERADIAEADLADAVEVLEFFVKVFKPTYKEMIFSKRQAFLNAEKLLERLNNDE